MKIKLSIIIFLLGISTLSQSQILISILFGDKLNSDKIEFGMVGGYNRSNFHGVSDASGLGNFDLGFYFHFALKNSSYLSTGLLVKANTGATGMATYSIGDEDFDELFKDGILTTKVSYFYVPILFQQRLWKIVQLEGGFQAGLRTKASDNFHIDSYDGSVEYNVSTRDNYAHLDAGLLGGVGIKLNDKPKSMSIGANYYYGLVNISKIAGENVKNSVLYVYMKIPIGLGKKPE